MNINLTTLLPQTILDELDASSPKASSSQSPQTSFTTASSSSLVLYPSTDRSSFHSTHSSHSMSSFASYEPFKDFAPSYTCITPPCQPRHFPAHTQPPHHIPMFLDAQVNVLMTLNTMQSIIDTFDAHTIIELLKTNKGSRHFQKLLNNSPPSQYETDAFVNIICFTIAELMCDYYGNYFLQKFVPYCSLRHRLLLYKSLYKNFATIANHQCGNHSLQSLIMLQNTKEEENIIRECIENSLQYLAYGQNSSHVIQKVIRVVREPNREYINTFVISNLVELSVDANGIGVVKEFIANMENEFYIMAVNSILELDMQRLTFDQNGNFAIQEMIKHFGNKYCAKMINKIVDHLFMFSISKFSSNVVDCVIDTLYRIDVNKFYTVMCKMVFDVECLGEMLKNKYANYVIENSLALLFSNTTMAYYNYTYSYMNVNMLQLQMNVYQILMNHPKVKEKNKIMAILRNCHFSEQ